MLVFAFILGWPLTLPECAHVNSRLAYSMTQQEAEGASSAA